MPKFIITWDAGYGDTSAVIEASDPLEAEQEAYEAWREEAESYAFYEAVPYSVQAAERLL